MINREDMLELTRRMTPSRTCFTRVAGAYMDEEGEIDGTFNIHFLKLKKEEMIRNLELAKTVPFAETNQQLVEHRLGRTFQKPGGMYQLLCALKQCGLKDEILTDVFYQQIADVYAAPGPYAIFLFAATYDVPVKARDGVRLDESEEVYDFLIGTISPLAGEYEPGPPVFGFLFPAFTNRSSDPDRILIYHRNPKAVEEGLVWKLTGEEAGGNPIRSYSDLKLPSELQTNVK